MSPGASEEAVALVPIPANALPGIYTLTITGTSAGGVAASSTGSFVVLPAEG
jgi:hypothetical protein